MMPDLLRWETINPPLKAILRQLMREPLFDSFRLVGGTGLSLQMGHRLSVDLDLFTNSIYGSLNFDEIDQYLRKQFSYVSHPVGPPAIGRSYFIGGDEKNTVKLDLYYFDAFIEPILEIDGIRLATTTDILAMKLDVISRGGRKKDFWDIHAFLSTISFENMLKLHERMYPFQHDPELLQTQITNFDKADEDFDPICLFGKDWDMIKLDFLEFMHLL